MTKGLTPSSESVLLQLKRQVVHNPFAEVASLPPRKNKSAFQWLARWRRRWGCCFQHLLALSHMTAAEKYAKAGARKKQPRGGRNFLPSLPNVLKNGGRFTAAKFGPLVEKQEGRAPKNGRRFSGMVAPWFIFARAQG